MSDTHAEPRPPAPADAPPPRPLVGPLAAAALVAGGALFFLGGALHPHDDPPDVTLEEHLRVMFENPAWYPAHAVLFVGMALMTAGLVALARGRALAPAPRAQSAATVAAVTAVAATAASLLHLVTAVESDRIASGASTPLVDANGIVETLTAPAFGLAVAALAVLGATSRIAGRRPLSGRPAAVFAVVGGVGYALAGGTFLLTDALDGLFPLAGAIGVWAVACGARQLAGGRAAGAGMSYGVHAAGEAVTGRR